MQAKSLLGANIELRIQEDISSIENFLAFNKLLSNNRRISPPTSSKQPFPSLSEQELAQFFLETSTIEEKIIEGGSIGRGQPGELDRRY
jgi:ADP-glucose pyrophosphorylase